MNEKKRKKAYQHGRFAEMLACAFLLLKGYSIKKRRFKTPVGEIDIIAVRGNITVFCEVKARADQDTAAESISMKQRARISRAAEYYMSDLKSDHNNNKIYRCDAILIVPWRWPIHIENAW